jgi:hypothetical protein
MRTIYSTAKVAGPNKSASPMLTYFALSSYRISVSVKLLFEKESNMGFESGNTVCLTLDAL